MNFIFEIAFWVLFSPLFFHGLLITFQAIISRPQKLYDSVSDSGVITKDISCTVLIPAHNEEMVIKETIETLIPQLSKTDKILVVADNCSDETVNILQQLRANYIERKNEDEIGKGFALSFGVSHIKEQYGIPDILVIVDADCDCSNFNLQELKLISYNSNKAVQSLYLMSVTDSDSMSTKVSTFAWYFRGWIRQNANAILGMPAQLQGTGMAFPANIVQDFEFATDSIVEDLEYGLSLSRQNRPAQFTEKSMILSKFPDSSRETTSQRSRWEHGHLSVILNELPKYFLAALKDKNYKLFWQVLDASVPPLSLLVLCSVIISTGALFISDDVIIISFSIMQLGLLFIGPIIGWIKIGRNIISFLEILYIPIFILHKLKIYINYIFNKQKSWNKTKRD